MLKESVNLYVEKKWKEEIKEKRSLKYLNPDSLKVGQTHHVYSTVRPNKEDIKRSELKVKLLLSTYTFQSNNSVFNQHGVDPTCRLCKNDPESREHFIAKCTFKSLQDIRRKYLRLFQKTINNENTGEEKILDFNMFTQIVLDSSHQDVSSTVCISPVSKERLEFLSREYLWKIHIARCQQLAKCQ